MGQQPSTSNERYIWALFALSLTACAGVVDDGFELGGGAGDRLGGVGAACQSSAAVEPIHRLTRAETANIAQDVLGISVDEVRALPPETLTNGFELAGPMSRAELNGWLVVAETLASRAVQRSENLTCATAGDVHVCAREIIARLGLRLFRHPLTDSESTPLQAMFASEFTRTGRLPSAMETVVTAMLVAPQFLFHDAAMGNAGATVQITGYEMASRLAFALWASAPDAALIEAAARGELTTAAQVRAQAERMMIDPKFERGVAEFFRQYLRLDRLALIERTDTQFTTDLRSDYRRSLEAFVRKAIVEDDSIESLMSSHVVFVNQRLGALLGRTDVVGNAMQAIEFPANERTGLLTQPGFMALMAKADGTDPIHRGLFVLQDVFCVQMGEPPPNVGQLPAVTPGLSLRARFAMHRNNPTCASCHNMIDPLGFPFENYDLLGRYRTLESGLPIDSSGQVTVPMELAGPIQNASELLARIPDSRSVHRCLASKWMSYAMRRDSRPEDACNANEHGDAFQADGGSFRRMLANVVSSGVFRTLTVN